MKNVECFSLENGIIEKIMPDLWKNLIAMFYRMKLKSCLIDVDWHLLDPNTLSIEDKVFIDIHPRDLNLKDIRTRVSYKGRKRDRGSRKLDR